MAKPNPRNWTADEIEAHIADVRRENGDDAASIERQIIDAWPEGWDVIDAEPGEWALMKHPSGRTWEIRP